MDTGIPRGLAVVGGAVNLPPHHHAVWSFNRVPRDASQYMTVTLMASAAVSVWFIGVAISPTRVVALWHQCTFHMSTMMIAVSCGFQSTTVWLTSHSSRPTCINSAQVMCMKHHGEEQQEEEENDENEDEDEDKGDDEDEDKDFDKDEEDEDEEDKRKAARLVA